MGSGKLTEDAYSTGTTFVPTMRIKKWKPKDVGKLVKGREYCYMDTSDSWFSGEQSCTPDLFEGQELVADVFTDNRQDLTRSYPTNKCVIAVDKEKATDENLNRFWDRVGEIECQSQFAWAQNSNAFLKSENTRLTGVLQEKKGEIETLKKTIKQKEQDIAGRNQTVTELDSDIAETRVRNQQLSDAIRTTKAALEEGTNEFSVVRTTCERTKTDLSDVIATLDNSIRDTTLLLSNIQGSNAILKTQYDKLLVAYTTDTAGYSNVYIQNSNLQIANATLEAANRKLVQDLDTTRTNIKTKTDALNSCVQERKVQDARGTELQNQLNVCTSALATCQTNLKACSDTRSQLQITYSNVYSGYIKCNDILTQCIAHQNDLIAQSNQLDYNIKEWMRTHFICGSQVAALEASNVALTAQHKLCRVQDVTVYDQMKVTALSTVAQTTGDQLTACVADTNSIFTSLPQRVPPAEIKPMKPSTLVTRAVTCPISMFTDDFCPYIPPIPGSNPPPPPNNICAQYLPGKNAKLEESRLPTNLNGARWAYWCSYEAGHGDEMDQVSADNAQIIGQAGKTVPPIWLMGKYHNDEGGLNDGHWFQFVYPEVWVAITSIKFLSSYNSPRFNWCRWMWPNDGGDGSGNNHTDTKGAEVMYAKSFEVKVTGPYQLQFGSGAFNFKDAPYGLYSSDVPTMDKLDSVNLSPFNPSSGTCGPLPNNISVPLLFAPGSTTGKPNSKIEGHNPGAISKMMIPQGCAVFLHENATWARMFVGPGIFKYDNGVDMWGGGRAHVITSLTFSATWDVSDNRYKQINLSSIEPGVIYYLNDFYQWTFLPSWIRLTVYVKSANDPKSNQESLSLALYRKYQEHTGVDWDQYWPLNLRESWWPYASDGISFLYDKPGWYGAGSYGLAYWKYYKINDANLKIFAFSVEPMNKNPTDYSPKFAPAGSSISQTFNIPTEWNLVQKKNEYGTYYEKGDVKKSVDVRVSNI